MLSISDNEWNQKKAVQRMDSLRISLFQIIL
jgi:hypothetical protein